MPRRSRPPVYAITLEQYVDTRFSELDRRVTDTAIVIAEASRQRHIELERRLGMLNELRNEVLADRALFVTKDTFELVRARLEQVVIRDYYDTQHEALEQRVQVNTEALASLRTRQAAYTAAIGIVFTIFVAIVAVINLAK